MSDFEPVTPGPAFQAEWAKWQKQLREWRQAYDEWRQVLQQLQEWDEKESKGIQLPSIDPNFDVFGVENILDIGEGEPLFGNFEYEDWLLLSTRVELHLLVHHFRDDTGGAVLDESNLAHYYKCYFKKNFKPEDFAVRALGTTGSIFQGRFFEAAALRDGFKDSFQNVDTGAPFCALLSHGLSGQQAFSTSTEPQRVPIS
ncbi:Hnrnpu [Symbiodinium sp. CCMP2456]|nr:Hnrnpu [Symbiodinium sp. CCMP2456]